MARLDVNWFSSRRTIAAVGRFALIVLGLAGCGRLAFDPRSCEESGERRLGQPFVGPARYVVPAGGSDSNPGTEAAPWATIAHAMTAAAADETIVLLDGLYERLRVNVDGRTVVAANDGAAIFDGGGTTVPCDITGNNITVEGVHCITPDPTEALVDPMYDVATYGRGA